MSYPARTSLPGVAPVYSPCSNTGVPDDERRDVAIDALHQPPAARGQVVADLRHVQAQALEVDHVDVRFQPRRQPAAIGKAEEVRRLAGLPLDDQLQRQPGPRFRSRPQCVSIQLGSDWHR